VSPASCKGVRCISIILFSSLNCVVRIGCSLGDRWDCTVPSARPNDNMKWFTDLVHDELDLPLVLKGILHPADADLAVRLIGYGS
jgi:hypothetical protein